TPMLSGDGSVRLASVIGRVRDAKAKAYRDAQCRIVPSSSDIAEIRDFLAECGAGCPCAAGLTKRLAELEGQAAACEGEGLALERLAKRGAGALASLKALAAGAACASVKAKAEALIASFDEDAKRAAVEAKRKADEAAEARRKANADA
ncbi:MAG TPA: hypothetical protein PK264_19690, partial [Hyphomicrobiaceae bacterium]|nr:hypothetical protein [Hyphomicrobiaceae bacterium]